MSTAEEQRKENEARGAYHGALDQARQFTDELLVAFDQLRAWVVRRPEFSVERGWFPAKVQEAQRLLQTVQEKQRAIDECIQRMNDSAHLAKEHPIDVHD